MECTLSEMSSNKWTAFHDLPTYLKFFSCLLKLPMLQTKKPEGCTLGFGGIGKCLINTALYIGEESHV